jgi:hypothetical protein
MSKRENDLLTRKIESGARTAATFQRKRVTRSPDSTAEKNSYDGASDGDERI